MRYLDVLNLGAGVQSTTVYLLSVAGELPWFDAAIMADTQEEPAAVYAHLDWLRTLGGPPILVRTVSKLGDDLARGVNSRGRRFVSIPAFTAPHHEQRGGRLLTGCEAGITRRQCTKEYKVDVVERTIRRELLGLKPRQRFPADVRVRQHFGISYDERGRAERIVASFKKNVPWSEPVFPLIERRWTRADCLEYLKDRVPHQVPRSACVFCPYHDNREWLRLKNEDPAAWKRAVEIDNALRVPGNVVNRNLDQALYLHRLCVPLEAVNLEAEAAKEEGRKRTPLFTLMDCGTGMCGV